LPLLELLCLASGQTDKHLNSMEHQKRFFLLRQEEKSLALVRDSMKNGINLFGKSVNKVGVRRDFLREMKFYSKTFLLQSNKAKAMFVSLHARAGLWGGRHLNKTIGLRSSLGFP
jgi:hypothetical protein